MEELTKKSSGAVKDGYSGGLFGEDINKSADLLARLSIENPEDITPELLRQAIGQAAVDKLAAELSGKARIINLNFDELAERFIARYDSKHTRIKYQHGINVWRAWCNAQGINPFEASGDVADKYSADLRNQSLGAGTINGRINAVSSFYAHLVKRGHLDRTPFIHIRRAKTLKKKKTVPTAREMLDAIAGNENDCTAVQIMLATGCRVGALASMQIDRGGKWVAISKGKQHAGIIDDPVLIKNAIRVIPSGYFENTGRLTLRINRAFKKAKLAGGAHQCRHRFALDLYKASGNDPEAVRSALGHADLAVTTAYLHGLTTK